MQVLEYVGQFVDLVDGRPDGVVAAVAGRDPPLKDGRVFLPNLRTVQVHQSGSLRITCNQFANFEVEITEPWLLSISIANYTKKNVRLDYRVTRQVGDYILLTLIW